MAKNIRRRKRVNWPVLVIYVAFLVLDFIFRDISSNSVSDTIRPVIIDAIIIGVLFWAIRGTWKGKD